MKTNRSVKNIKKTVLVTGTPGVGKSTTANKLATKLGASCIGITELVKTENLVTDTDKHRATLVADTKKVSKRLQEIIDNSEGTVIVEGHYVADVVPNKHVDTVFVLRRDPTELKSVLEKRGYSEKKVYENLAAEILDVCLYDAVSAFGIGKVCEIDVSNKTVDNVVDEIVMVLEKKHACQVGIVDWLGKLEKMGQLEEFLKGISLAE